MHLTQSVALFCVWYSIGVVRKIELIMYHCHDDHNIMTGSVTWFPEECIKNVIMCSWFPDECYFN